MTPKQYSIPEIVAMMRAYNPKADEYGGVHVVPWWADLIEAHHADPMQCLRQSVESLGLVLTEREGTLVLETAELGKANARIAELEETLRLVPGHIQELCHAFGHPAPQSILKRIARNLVP